MDRRTTVEISSAGLLILVMVVILIAAAFTDKLDMEPQQWIQIRCDGLNPAWVEWANKHHRPIPLQRTKGCEPP